MSSSTLIEVFGHIVFSFTRGVTEHYNPEEPEFTAESFGYDPLQSTGREWYYLPVDELIYQEYSDREATSLDYLASSSLDVRVIDACSPEENEETQDDQQDEDRAMAWKRLRPSALRTVCKSMYIGALISLLTATIIGSVYMLITYLSYKTNLICQFQPKKSIPLQVQWMKTICDIISGAFTYTWCFAIMLFLFPPTSVNGGENKTDSAFNKQDKEGKLLIAIFSPLIGVILKAISRISVQRLWNITHPGYSYALLVPLYFGTAVGLRVLQADLDSLQSIAILGIIHGAAEVIERSTMVVIDHICHVISKRTSVPWGSFRTPRRERLMADIAIMSMLYESTAIVAVNGFLHLYQFIFVQNASFLELLQSFAIRTSVPLVIEWFFVSVSLAIETRYQNMAVMAVWRRRWKRHILVAIVNVVPLALWQLY
ncbi:hypothetical protein ACROYT_G037931 [Oculina patagonica]